MMRRIMARMKNARSKILSQSKAGSEQGRAD